MVAVGEGRVVNSAWAIVVAGILDMLDGRIARLAQATSSFGVQYDSLSDLVSFGVAPALLVHQWLLRDFGQWGLLGSMLYLTGGAFRLARFNLTTTLAKSHEFQGLPITVAGGTLATFVLYVCSILEPAGADWPIYGVMEFPGVQRLALLLTFTLFVFMVSAVPFPAFKALHWRSRASAGWLIAGVLLLLMVVAQPEATLFGVFALYELIYGSRFVVRWVLDRVKRSRYAPVP